MCVCKINNGQTFFSEPHKIHQIRIIYRIWSTSTSSFIFLFNFLYICINAILYIYTYIQILLELRAGLSLAWLLPVSFEKKVKVLRIFSISFSFRYMCLDTSADTSKRLPIGRSLCVRCMCYCWFCLLLYVRFHYILAWTLGDQYELEINSDGWILNYIYNTPKALKCRIRGFQRCCT